MMTAQQALRYLFISLILPASFGGQFCTSSGSCMDDSSSSSIFVAAKRTGGASCEASDCDGSGILQHHTNNTIEDNIGVACRSESDSSKTRANGFLRCFEGNLCSASQNIVQSLGFSVDSSDVANAEFTLNFFKGSAGDCADKHSVANLYKQGPTASTPPSPLGSGELFTVNADVTSLGISFAPSDSLLVEVAIDDLRDVGKVFLAANTAEQCDDSYLRAESCGAQDPKPLSEIQTNNIVSYLIQLEVSQDDDGDGVINDNDDCPMTASGVAVDSFGCSDLQADADGDGVCDFSVSSNAVGPSLCVGQDLCLETDPGVEVDEDGCADGQDPSPGDDDGCFSSIFAPFICAMVFVFGICGI